MTTYARLEEVPACIQVGMARLDGQTVICLHGDLDVQTAPYFREFLGIAISTSDDDIVIVAQDVGRIDAAGIGVLVGGMRRARAAERTLEIAAPSPSTYRLLRLTGLSQLLRTRTQPVVGWLDPCPEVPSVA
jgi:anti-sigma B factor antagonist